MEKKEVTSFLLLLLAVFIPYLYVCGLLDLNTLRFILNNFYIYGWWILLFSAATALLVIVLASRLRLRLFKTRFSKFKLEVLLLPDAVLVRRLWGLTGIAILTVEGRPRIPGVAVSYTHLTLPTN